MQRRMFMRKRLLGVTTGRSALMGAMVALTLVWSTLAAPPMIASAGTVRAAPSACPAAVPVAELKAGMRGTGRTVSQGTKPERFTAKILGVLNDGIAPGVDMIIVETDSRAIRRAQGIWAGMSGSPVYAQDGRLIGALAYGFTLGPSRLAGLTPAENMLEVLDYPAGQPDTTQVLQAQEQVALSPDLKAAIAAQSDATAAQLAQGFTQLRIPLSVSGLDEGRLARFTEELGERGTLQGRFIPYVGAAAPSTPSMEEPTAIVPGGNFAGALSYGDLTVAGIGTTTLVCNGRVLAFGHPLTFGGTVELSAHSADVITVVTDPTLGVFKLANAGPAVGTINQDRLTAIRTQLGAAPTGITVTSTVTATDTGRTRTGTTEVNQDEDVPLISAFHLLANLERVFDSVGAGSSQVRWTATGTTAEGQPWTVTRENRFASLFDITFESIFEQLNMLQIIQQNVFEAVQFTDVTITVTASEAYRAYRLGVLQVRQPDGRYVTVNANQPLSVDAGASIDARVQLLPYQGQGKETFVAFTVEVPEEQAGSQGTLNVSGGQSTSGAPSTAATSFPELLEELQAAPRNDEVIAALTFIDMNGASVVADSFRQQADQVVSGAISIQVIVNPSP